MVTTPPNRRQLVRAGVNAVVIVVALGLLLALTPIVDFRAVVPLLIAYSVVVVVVTFARWLQAKPH